MAQRSTRSQASNERKSKEDELKQVEGEQLYLSALDDPAQPDQASPIRGWAYFAAILAFALLLNLVLLVFVSGGR